MTQQPPYQTPPLPGAGRKLDALVHIKLGHSEWFTYESDIWEEDGEEHSEIFYEATSLTVPEYSTDIGAAWEIVELMRAKGYDFYVHVAVGKDWVAGFVTNKPGGASSQFQADTAPHAICLAFLALPDEVTQ